MTHFYVCLRAWKNCETKEIGGYEWHAGITDRKTWKQRSSLYKDCVMWEEFNSRDEAMEFEGLTERIVGAVFFEENNAHAMATQLRELEQAKVEAPQTLGWRQTLIESLQKRIDDGWQVEDRSTGDTTTQVDALTIASIYQEMLSMYQSGELQSKEWEVTVSKLRKLKSSTTVAEEREAPVSMW